MKMITRRVASAAAVAGLALSVAPAMQADAATSKAGEKWTYCGNDILITKGGSCGFARNVVSGGRRAADRAFFRAYSPTTKKRYVAVCSSNEWLTVCASGKNFRQIVMVLGNPPRPY